MKNFDKDMKLRVNDKMIGILEEQVACDASTTSKSDWLRQVILSSIDFDKNLGLKNMYWLENHAENSIRLFSQSGVYFEADKISDDFPAFLIENQDSAIIAIKRPIYKVRIVNRNLFSKEMIKELLETKSGLTSDIDICLCYEPVLMVNDYLRKSWNDTILSVLCFGQDLRESEKIKNMVVDILQEKGCKIEIWPEYVLHNISVELHTVNGKKFIKTL